MQFPRGAVAVQTHFNPSPQSSLSEREALDCEILDLLEQEPGITQRELARRMGGSLGRTNYCLQALAEKGWLKLERFRRAKNKGRYVYVLTPGGIAGRGRLAGRFLERKRAEYAYLKAQIARLERDAHRAKQKFWAAFPPDDDDDVMLTLTGTRGSPRETGQDHV